MPESSITISTQIYKQESEKKLLKILEQLAFLTCNTNKIENLKKNKSFWRELAVRDWKSEEEEELLLPLPFAAATLMR